MSAIARYFMSKGLVVAGYDKTPSDLTHQLEKEGMLIHYEESVDDIPRACTNPLTTLVVYTPAIPAEHKELVWFKEKGFEIQKRSQVLGTLTRTHKGLCFAGTHGKTTTSTMCAHIMHQSHLDCNAFLGGISKNYGTNYILSRDSDYVVIEADEFDRSFHWLRPWMTVITSTDPDHLDIYGTKEAYLEIAKLISELPGLEFSGIQAYAGYASHMVSSDERVETTRANIQKVAELKEYLLQNGIEVRTVSGGSTGTSAIKADSAVYTELQAGSYLFMDSTYNQLDIPFRNSLFVLSTVVSKSAGTVILDVGVKGLGADQNLPVILDESGKAITGRIVLNEEHLKLYDSDWNPSIGNKVFVIPGHCCSTVNLYDNLYLYSGDSVTERIPVTGRGKSQ